jgi:hypothetical protein
MKSEKGFCFRFFDIELSVGSNFFCPSEKFFDCLSPLMTGG